MRVASFEPVCASRASFPWPEERAEKRRSLEEEGKEGEGLLRGFSELKKDVGDSPTLGLFSDVSGM